MTDVERAIAAWKVAQQFLAKERADRLYNMTDGDTQRAVAALFAYRDVASEPAALLDLPTGLIEQQRLFRLIGSTQA